MSKHIVYNFGYAGALNTSMRFGFRSSGIFNPLSLSPTFWFNYNTYEVGNFTGTEIDETGNYTITPFNNAGVATDIDVNSMSTSRAGLQCVSYGSTFNTELKNSHTHVFAHRSKDLIGVDAFCGVDDGAGEQYSILKNVKKVRLFVKIGGVNNIFESVNDVYTSTTPYYITIITVQQSGVTIEVNGTNLPLDNTAFTSTLSNLNITKELYTGARNNNLTIDTPTEMFLGQHLFVPSILTTEEKQNILNFFV